MQLLQFVITATLSSYYYWAGKLTNKSRWPIDS